MSPRPCRSTCSDTGLYVAGLDDRDRARRACRSRPQYPLWSDGATKRRWIDAAARHGRSTRANPDAWEFPPGTRLWKEFSVGRRVETRFIERLADGSWRFATYVWNEDGTDAVLAPAGWRALLAADAGARGRYAIPSEVRLPRVPRRRAGARARVQRAAALARPRSARAARRAAEPSTSTCARSSRAARAQSAAAVARAAAAHRGRVADRARRARLPARQLRPLPQQRPSETGAVGAGRYCPRAETPPSRRAPQPSLRSLIGAPSRFRAAGAARADARLVAPGDAHASVLTLRMRSRDPRVQMPPLGTAVPDTEALALIERWIERAAT